MLKDTKKEDTNLGKKCLVWIYLYSLFAAEVLIVITKNSLFLFILNLKLVHCLIVIKLIAHQFIFISS